MQKELRLYLLEAIIVLSEYTNKSHQTVVSLSLIT